MVYAYLASSTLLRSYQSRLPLTFNRYKSLTQAIERGKRHRASDKYPPRNRSSANYVGARPQSRADWRSAIFESCKIPDAGENKVKATGEGLKEVWSPQWGRERDMDSDLMQDSEFTHERDEWSERNERLENHSNPGNRRGPHWPVAPLVRENDEIYVDSLPFTTAASEFIYGQSSVLAAIKANRRKFYKLYVHSKEGARSRFLVHVRAHKLFPITREVDDKYLRAMDRASSGRPHNGVILEASPLPVPPITALQTPDLENQTISVVLEKQSAEDVLITGNREKYPYNSAGWRYPLVLYVDGVLDEGNLGAIARSAYFLGVDAVVTFAHHIAPWSNIALKASAGAAEGIPIFKVGHATQFLKNCMERGWKIYASTAPPISRAVKSRASPAQETTRGKVIYTMGKDRSKLNPEHCPLAEHPTILMLGSEAMGLKPSLVNLAHYNVSIPSGRHANDIGVDSLNVSVAASMLCYEMLQRPMAKPVGTGGNEESLF